MRALVYFLVLMATWVALSGHHVQDPFLLAAGVFSAALVTAITARLGLLGSGRWALDVFRVPIRYLPWLAIQVIRANLDVAYRVWHPKLPISPRMVELTDELTTDAGTALFANSITLTPGTVTVAIVDGKVLVHALTEKGADQLATGEMQARVKKLEVSA